MVFCIILLFLFAIYDGIHAYSYLHFVCFGKEKLLSALHSKKKDLTQTLEQLPFVLYLLLLYFPVLRLWAACDKGLDDILGSERDCCPTCCKLDLLVDGSAKIISSKLTSTATPQR